MIARQPTQAQPSIPLCSLCNNSSLCCRNVHEQPAWMQDQRDLTGDSSLLDLPQELVLDEIWTRTSFPKANAFRESAELDSLSAAAAVPRGQLTKDAKPSDI